MVITSYDNDRAPFVPARKETGVVVFGSGRDGGGGGVLLKQNDKGKLAEAE